MGSKAGDAQPGQTIAKAAFQNIAAQESGGCGRGDLERRSMSPGFRHLTCAEGRVTLANHAMVVGSIGGRIMQQVTSEDFNARAGIHLYRFVNVRALPARQGFPEKAQLSIWVPAAAMNPTTHIKRAARDQVAAGELFRVLTAQLLN